MYKLRIAWDFPSGPMQEAWVQSLVRELKSYMPQGMAKRKEIGRTMRN